MRNQDTNINNNNNNHYDGCDVGGYDDDDVYQDGGNELAPLSR